MTYLPNIAESFGSCISLCISSYLHYSGGSIRRGSRMQPKQRGARS